MTHVLASGYILTVRSDTIMCTKVQKKAHNHMHPAYQCASCDHVLDSIAGLSVSTVRRHHTDVTAPAVSASDLLVATTSLYVLPTTDSGGSTSSCMGGSRVSRKMYGESRRLGCK